MLNFSYDPPHSGQNIKNRRKRQSGIPDGRKIIRDTAPPVRKAKENTKIRKQRIQAFPAKEKPVIIRKPSSVGKADMTGLKTRRAATGRPAAEGMNKTGLKAAVRNGLNGSKAGPRLQNP